MPSSKGQIGLLAKGDVVGQIRFIHQIYGIAAETLRTSQTPQEVGLEEVRLSFSSNVLAGQLRSD